MGCESQMGETQAEVHPMRFDQLAIEVKDKIDPGEADVDRYVGLEHLEPESLTIRMWGSPEDVDSTKIRFQEGDVIFGKRRAYQRKLALADFDGICSAHAMVLRPVAEVMLPDFFPFFLQSEAFMSRAVKISVGGLSPTINWGDLAREEFLVPTLQRQRRLANALMSARDCAESQRSVLDRLKMLRLATVFDYEADLAPSEMTTLADVTAGLEAGSSPPSTGKSVDSGQNGVLKVSAVGDWQFVPSESKAVNMEDFDKSVTVGRGDLLVTRANADPASVGRTCIVLEDRPDLMLSDKTWRLCLEPVEHPYDPMGIVAWSKGRTFRRHVLARLNGTDAKNISQRNFLSGPIPRLDDGFKLLSQRVRLLTRGIDEAGRRAEEARQLQRLILAEGLGE